MTFFWIFEKKVLAPKWTKCVQIGPKMRFLSVFSSLNHQIRLILHFQAHFYCLELLLQQNWLKKFLDWKFDRLNYFNGFWLFSHVFFIRNRWFCTFKLFSTVFIYLLSIWVVKIFWASKFSCLQIIFCLQITIFAF